MTASPRKYFVAECDNTWTDKYRYSCVDGLGKGDCTEEDLLHVVQSLSRVSEGAHAPAYHRRPYHPYLSVDRKEVAQTLLTVDVVMGLEQGYPDYTQAVAACDRVILSKYVCAIIRR